MTRRRKALSAEDRALWAHVARSVKAFRTNPDLGNADEALSPVPEAACPPAVAVTQIKRSNATPIPPLAAIERPLRRQLSRGQASPDAVLDLHGLTQDAAHHRLVAFLRSAQTHGFKLVTVITGKGAPRHDMPRSALPRHHDATSERGVLRRMVPHWLTAPDLRPVVIGFEAAGPGHGGDGALFVRIRRPRGVS